MRLHDIGIELLERDGVIGAKIFAGGGMGRTPMVAPEIKDFVTEDELISYVEACLRVYNRYGRRETKFKARIKILIHELGVDEYRRPVEEEFAHMRSEEHTTDLQSLMPTTYAVFCLKKTNISKPYNTSHIIMLIQLTTYTAY